MSGIFVSYRRSDSAGHTGRLVDDLGEQLVGQALFRDIEAIEAGEDFVQALERAVGACAAMLVVIGPTWAKVVGPDGQPRLHQSGDFVRMEIEAALARDVRVIPVLVGDAQMPMAADLPASMAPLLRRNAYSISDRRWRYDIDQLLDILEKIPGVSARKRAPPPPPPAVPLPVRRAPATSMPTWTKVVLGLVAAFFGLAAVGLLLDPSIMDPVPAATDATASVIAAPAAAAAPAAPATPSIAAAEFTGSWLSEDGLYYTFVEDGDTLVALSGAVADPDRLAVEVSPAPPPTRAGEELAGVARIEGRRLDVTLTDTFSGETEELRLTLSGDGRRLTGQSQGAATELRRQ